VPFLGVFRDANITALTSHGVVLWLDVSQRWLDSWGHSWGHYSLMNSVQNAFITKYAKDAFKMFRSKAPEHGVKGKPPPI